MMSSRGASSRDQVGIECPRASDILNLAMANSGLCICMPVHAQSATCSKLAIARAQLQQLYTVLLELVAAAHQSQASRYRVSPSSGLGPAARLYTYCTCIGCMYLHDIMQCQTPVDSRSPHVHARHAIRMDGCVLHVLDST